MLRECPVTVTTIKPVNLIGTHPSSQVMMPPCRPTKKEIEKKYKVTKNKNLK